MDFLYHVGRRPVNGNVELRSADGSETIDHAAARKGAARGQSFHVDEFEFFELGSGEEQATELMISLLNIREIEPLRAFIMQYGFIQTVRMFDDGHSAEVEVQLSAARDLQQFNNSYGSSDPAQKKSMLARANIVFALQKGVVGISLHDNLDDGRLEARISINSLYVFAIFQIIAAAKTNQPFKVCNNCGKAFRPKAQARKDTGNCSGTCRVAWNRKKKKLALNQLEM